MDWTVITTWLIEHGPRILLMIVIYVVLSVIMHRLVPVVVRRSVVNTMKKKPKTAIEKRTKTLSSVFIQTGAVITGIIIVFMILSEVGVDVGPALAGLGIAGIAVGFGAQSLVKDFFNGLFILLENQYGIGDIIKVAGVIGTVEDINFRRTVLRDLDGIVHSIPNSEISIASNYTKERSRINMNISVGYGEDLNHVIDVINRVGTELAEDPDWEKKILSPPQVLRVDAFEDSGIAIKILGDTKPLEQWALMGELRLRLKAAFDAEGIEIPWPHTRVFFGNSISLEEIPNTSEINSTAPQSLSEKNKQPSKRRKALPPEDEN